MDFSKLPLRPCEQLLETARSHLMTTTCKAVREKLHYALDVRVNKNIYYAFRGTVPYVIKIPKYANDAAREFAWSERINSPYIIKYIELVSINEDCQGLVMSGKCCWC